MVARYTTLCEFWTLKQSKNHVMMGSIDAWFYRTLAGIALDEASPAYGAFTVRPFAPEELDRASARIDTVRGAVSSSWERRGRDLSLEVEVPFNTAALVHVPAGMSDAVSETGEGPRLARFVRWEGGYHVLRAPSGRYRFEARRPTVAPAP
jgi:alpha-L-rhamnosidase